MCKLFIEFIALHTAVSNGDLSITLLQLQMLMKILKPILLFLIGSTLMSANRVAHSLVLTARNISLFLPQQCAGVDLNVLHTVRLPSGVVTNILLKVQRCQFIEVFRLFKELNI